MSLLKDGKRLKEKKKSVNYTKLKVKESKGKKKISMLMQEPIKLLQSKRRRWPSS